MNDLHRAYAVLGLDAGSSMEVIERRYKRLIMVWHPDRAPTPEHKEFAEEELKKINNAKDLLTKHFGSAGGHKPSGCNCQPDASSKSTTGQKTSSNSAGPGPGYHRTKTADDKAREEESAKKRDAERRARQQAEANASQAQQQTQLKASQQSMESALQQQKSLQDEKLRWQIATWMVIVFIALEVFGSMAIGAKKWWNDTSWRWKQDHYDHGQNANPGTGTTTSPPRYVAPYNQLWQDRQSQ